MNPIDTSSMQANLRALQEALKNVDDGKYASEIKDVSVAANDAGLTISYVAKVNGTTVPIVISTSPELDAPTKSPDGASLGELIEKLGTLNVAEMSSEDAEAFAKDLLTALVETIQTQGLRTTTVTESGGSGAAAPGQHTLKRTGKDGSGPTPLGSSGDNTTVTSGATLFNLLEILTLIVETGQKLKKATKDIKAAEAERQAKAYEDQASETLTMANVAKSEGLKYTVISACMMAVSAAASIGSGIVGAKAVSSGTKASGVASQMANEVLDTKTSASLDTATTTAGKASTNFLNRTQPTRAAAAGDMEVEMGEMAPGQQRPSRVDEIKGDFANNPQIVAARNAYKAALEKTEPPATPEEIAKAKDDYVSAVMAVKGKYDAAYVNASPGDADAKYHEMVVANEVAMKHLKVDTVSVTKDGATTVRPILTPQDRVAIKSACAKAYKTDMAGESDYRVAAVAAGGPIIGQLANVLNQHWQSSVSYKAQSDMASAQEKSAEATRADKDYEDTKNLEQSAQSVIDAARQTMAKAYESERDAVREIFG